MNLRDTVEQHVVTVVIIASVAAGGLVFGVVQYFHSQRVTQLEAKHHQDIRQLKSRLASIERGMPDQKYYDIRQLMYTKGLEAQVPVESKYFDEDNFYARIDNAYWQYQKSTEGELAELITGEEPSRTSIEVGKIAPIHLWKSSESYTIEIDGETTVNFFPFIFLQRLPFEKVPQLLGIGASFARWLEEPDDFDFDEEDLKPSDDVDEIVQKLSSLMRDDMTGMAFHFINQSQMQIALVFPNVRYRLITVQKIANVLYSQSVTEFRDVGVNGEQQHSFFLRTELILVSTEKNLYVIKLLVPSSEPLPRGDSYAQVTEWLSNMRVVID